MSESSGLGWYSQTPNDAASKAGGLWLAGAPLPFDVLRKSVSSAPLSQTWRFSSVGLEPSSNSSMHCHWLGSDRRLRPRAKLVFGRSEKDRVAEVLLGAADHARTGLHVAHVVLAEPQDETHVKVGTRHRRQVGRKVHESARVKRVGSRREGDRFREHRGALLPGRELDVHGVLPAVYVLTIDRDRCGAGRLGLRPFLDRADRSQSLRTARCPT